MMGKAHSLSPCGPSEEGKHMENVSLVAEGVRLIGHFRVGGLPAHSSAHCSRRLGSVPSPLVAVTLGLVGLPVRGLLLVPP